MSLTTILLILVALLPGTSFVSLWPGILALGSQIEQSTTTVPPPIIAVQPIKTGSQPLELEAKSAIAIDRVSGRILYSKNSDSQLPIASITKLATVITVLHSHSLDQLVTVPSLPIYKPEDELVGLAAGERWKVRDLVAAALIGSGNDAADALAIMDSGSKEAFAVNMNARLKEWGIGDINFNNPSGLIDSGNGASVQAVAQMGLLVLHNTDLSKLVNTKNLAITSQGGRRINLETTNQLLQNGGFSGIKTGYTLAAGECFVGLTESNGHQIVTAVLGSPDRFGESSRLAAWINRNFQWQ